MLLIPIFVWWLLLPLLFCFLPTTPTSTTPFFSLCFCVSFSPLLLLPPHSKHKGFTTQVAAAPMVTNRANIIESSGTIKSFAKPVKHNGSNPTCQRIEFRRFGCRQLLAMKLIFSSEASWSLSGKPCTYAIARGQSVLCHSRETLDTEAKECVTYSDDCRRNEEVEDLFGSISPEQSVEHTSTYSSQGLAEVFKFIYNDAKFVNDRARDDIVLLSRGIMRLNDRACQDVAVLGSEFLKLDARAREDTVKIDHGVKRKAERLHHIATILKNKAESKLKTVASKHWNDGALEADLRRADLLAKRRAMEDSYMAMEFVKNVHDLMVSNMYKLEGSLSANDTRSIMLEKNGITADFFPGDITSDRISAIQEAYWSMASALSETDGIDYTDPEELEYIVATLIDLDAMDGKSSVSLLVECSSSPDPSTRQALANALAAAPSMWTLGNAGMGALQRLSEDENPAIAAAASRTINELKKQWEIQEGDSLRFMMNQNSWKEEIENVANDNNDDEEKD